MRVPADDWRQTPPVPTATPGGDPLVRLTTPMITAGARHGWVRRRPEEVFARPPFAAGQVPA